MVANTESNHHSRDARQETRSAWWAQKPAASQRDTPCEDGDSREEHLARVCCGGKEGSGGTSGDILAVTAVLCLEGDYYRAPQCPVGVLVRGEKSAAMRQYRKEKEAWRQEYNCIGIGIGKAALLP